VAFGTLTSKVTPETSWVTDNALYVKAIKKPVTLPYIHVHFQHLNLNQYSNKMGQPLITQGTINRVRFGFPSLSEQEGIALILNSIQARTDLASGKRRILQETYLALLHELMSPKIQVTNSVLKL